MPNLIDEDDEDNVVPEAANAVQRGHLDDEGKQVVNEGVDGFVGQHAPREVRHGLHLEWKKISNKKILFKNHQGRIN